MKKLYFLSSQQWGKNWFYDKYTEAFVKHDFGKYSIGVECWENTMFKDCKLIGDGTFDSAKFQTAQNVSGDDPLDTYVAKFPMVTIDLSNATLMPNWNYSVDPDEFNKLLQQYKDKLKVGGESAQEVNAGQKRCECGAKSVGGKCSDYCPLYEE